MSHIIFLEHSRNILKYLRRNNLLAGTEHYCVLKYTGAQVGSPYNARVVFLVYFSMSQ